MDGEKAIWWEDEREIAELIWCAAHLDRIIAPRSIGRAGQPEKTSSTDGGNTDSGGELSPSPPEGIEPSLPLAYPEKSDRPTTTSPNRESGSEASPPPAERASPVRVPDPFPIPEPAAISKALSPLARRVPGLRADELDIEATVERTAEAGGLPILAFRPPLERWFEVHLLIDRSPPMEFWGDLAGGTAILFRWQGFFRDVRVWWFETGQNKARLLSGAGRIERDARGLVAPSGNRLFIVLTDTLGKAWRSGSAFATLAVLGKEHPVTIAHIFPRELWQRTALEGAILLPLIAPGSAPANDLLQVGEKLRARQSLYRFPIFNLSPAHFATWAKFIAVGGGNSIQGVLIRATTAGGDGAETVEEDASDRETESPEKLLRSFLIDASPLARELARVLAAVPLIPPVMRLAQRRFLPDSQHWHLAEVFFSGLVQKSTFSPEGATVSEAWYEFRPEIRELLLADSAARRTSDIWRGIGDYIRERYGDLRDFQALIPNPRGSLQDTASDRDLYFAEVDVAVLRTWGGEYAELASELGETVAGRKREIAEEIDYKSLAKDLQPFDIPIVTITFDFPPKLQFETVSVDRTGKIIKKETREAYYHEEALGEGIEPLTMLAIPAGEFRMGSPGEKDDDDGEKPQHRVKVNAFYLSQTPITRAQWQFVANLRREGRDLGPDPSGFKEGENYPVEKVSWYDAIEFCARLSRHTGGEYRLPSEAEWEYACRAGTTTPFYFGETIAEELANYNSSVVYRKETAKKSLGKTTPVRSYLPNAFGLYDMHGNVFEWCLDPWHGDYKGAPKDGSVWDKIDNENYYQNIIDNINILSRDERSRVSRGGCWYNDPRDCRSAYRLNVDPGVVNIVIGFRVVRVPPRVP